MAQPKCVCVEEGLHLPYLFLDPLLSVPQVYGQHMWSLPCVSIYDSAEYSPTAIAEEHITALSDSKESARSAKYLSSPISTRTWGGGGGRKGKGKGKMSQRLFSCSCLAISTIFCFFRLATALKRGEVVLDPCTATKRVKLLVLSTIVIPTSGRPCACSRPY